MCYNPSYAVYDSIFKKMNFITYEQYLNNKNAIKLSCGKCNECLINRQRSLINKINMFYSEFNKSTNMLFVTLTLEKLDNSKPSRNIGLFFKRLKKHLKLNNELCRYFWVFELGGQTLREHYHILISVPKYITKARLIQEINSCWHLGIIKIKDIFSNGISFYLSKYLSKQISKSFCKSFFSQGLLKYLYSKVVKINNNTCLINGYESAIPIYYRGRGNNIENFSNIRKKQDEKISCNKFVGVINDRL